MNGTHRRVTHKTRTLPILLALVSSAGMYAATLAPAHASDRGPLSGRAYGIGLSNITLLGSQLMPPGASPDTGLVQTSSTSTTTAPCGSDPGPYITATLLCPVVSTNADASSVHSTATAATAHIGLPGLPVIDAKAVKAVADASCWGGPSGSTTIDYLKVGGTVFISQRTVVKPNTVIDAGAVKVILNEQSFGGFASSTVNAIHVETGTASLVTADVVVSSAQAAVDCSQLSPLD